MMKYLLILALGLFIFSCSSKTNSEAETDESNLVSDRLPSFDIEFPETGFEIRESSNPSSNLPGNETSEWVMEGQDERGVFKYFVTQNILDDKMKESIKSSGNSLDELLEAALRGSISNYDGKELKFSDVKMHGYEGLEVRGIVVGEDFQGLFKNRVFTDGHTIFFIGSAGQSFNDADIDPFLNSFKIQ